MTLQSADFLHLYRERGVEMQMGGADQWGNITAGLELIRRVVGRAEGDPPAAFGLCSPLLLTREGQKMGKSEKGAVFLDPAMTSPYDFFQYWLNDDDQLVGQHLKWLTLMTADEVADLERAQSADPGSRPAQRALAFDLTARVHGRDEAERQVRVADAAFSGAPIRDPEVLDVLFGSLDHYEFGDEVALRPPLISRWRAGCTRRSRRRGGRSSRAGCRSTIRGLVPLTRPCQNPSPAATYVLRAGKKADADRPPARLSA